jgi:hypothetical protein
MTIHSRIPTWSRPGRSWVVRLGLVLGCLGACGDGPAAAATLELLGPDGAAVQVNGQSVGVFPLAEALILRPGEYVVTCRRRGCIPFEDTVVLQDDEDRIRLRVRLIPLNRTTAVTSSLLLAGLGQHYEGRPIEGWLMTAVEIGGLVTALSGEATYLNRRDDYELLLDDYRRAVSELEILRLRGEAEEMFARMKDAEDQRDTGLLVAAGAVVVSVLDAWLRFPSVEAGPGTVVPAQAAGAQENLDRWVTLASGRGSCEGFHIGWRWRF